METSAHAHTRAHVNLSLQICRYTFTSIHTRFFGPAYKCECTRTETSVRSLVRMFAKHKVGEDLENTDELRHVNTMMEA